MRVENSVGDDVAHLIGVSLGHELRGVQVYDSGVLYPYRAYMQGLLGHSKDYKETHLALAGFSMDEDLDDHGDPAYTARCALADGGATMEFIAPISADIFQQPRALLPFLDFKIVLHPASDAFRIEQRRGDLQPYSLVIEDLIFLSRQITCHDSTMLAIDAMLREHRLISYQLNSIQMRSFFISAGRLHAPEHKLFTTATPRTLICGFVASENFNGSTNTNPFYFRPFGVTEVFLDMGTETLPLRSWNMNFERNNCARAYLALQDTLGFTKSGESNGVTFNHFKDGHTFFGFDISPNAQDSDSRDLLKMGETSLRIRFGQAVPAGGIYCVVFAEFSSELGINAERESLVDPEEVVVDDEHERPVGRALVSVA
ncbi:hypothetical protein PRIPAC_89328 [Pristionchus pacificus]|uniref:Uncharacterized protein n=1 Tax=Pristionchus pacificus TaxID=54126 RepID=A0A2A6B789_PRIPA|nr:hypothetical protein PRIPAC_89328 [Pristionchus pacificus]|eukprot:PDM61734.1 hypothetical protein PRIPAC_51176 [Pristionchus pacificus]